MPSKATDSTPYPIDWRSEEHLQAAIERYAEAKVQFVLTKDSLFAEEMDKAQDEIYEIVHNIQRWFMYIGAFRGTAETLGINIRQGADWDSDTYTTDQSFDDLSHNELL